MNPPSLPGSKWFRWLRNLTLRVGVFTGVYLTAVFVVWVLAANRLPFLERLALIRNLAAVAAFALVMLVPIGTFLRRPLRLFASGLLGWLLFSLAYQVTGVFFENLHSRLRAPFNVFMLGVAVYGLVAVVSWVVGMAWEARHQPVIASRRRHP